MPVRRRKRGIRGRAGNGSGSAGRWRRQDFARCMAAEGEAWQVLLAGAACAGVAQLLLETGVSVYAGILP